ncbi:MAG: radical SAM family heme chaperone HemW [Egibacteraceae bacterium]
MSSPQPPLRCADNGRDTARTLHDAAPGLYLHVPFCAHRCHYCDFNTYAGLDQLMPRYVAALRADLRAVAAAGPDAVAPPSSGLVVQAESSVDCEGVRGNAPDDTEGPGGVLPVSQGAGRAVYWLSSSDPQRREAGCRRIRMPRVFPRGPLVQWPVFGSVFVGGGTPTMLDPADLAGILQLAREVLPVAADAEVTVEANPESVTTHYLARMVEAGMTRLSMGAQSFAPHVLAALGRRHGPERPLRALAAARATGVRCVNLDLIYGTPGETDADWNASLRAVMEAGVEHVSAYALTVEPATEYASRIRAGLAAAPDEDVQAERMAVTDRALSAAGLRRYEISSWAGPGQECRHNLTYWRGGDWLGVGAGAHGHWRGRRWWSLRSPARYADAALSGRSTTAGAEVLDESTRRAERLMLGLRLAEGVDLAAVAPLDEGQLGALVRAGLVRVEATRLHLTDAGWPLANAVTVRLLP